MWTVKVTVPVGVAPEPETTARSCTLVPTGAFVITLCCVVHGREDGRCRLGRRERLARSVTGGIHTVARVVTAEGESAGWHDRARGVGDARGVERDGAGSAALARAVRLPRWTVKSTVPVGVAPEPETTAQSCTLVPTGAFVTTGGLRRARREDGRCSFRSFSVHERAGEGVAAGRLMCPASSPFSHVADWCFQPPVTFSETEYLAGIAGRGVLLTVREREAVLVVARVERKRLLGTCRDRLFLDDDDAALLCS